MSSRISGSLILDMYVGRGGVYRTVQRGGGVCTELFREGEGCVQNCLEWGRGVYFGEYQTIQIGK